MGSVDKKLETKRIWIYLGITFGLTWAYSLGIIYPIIRNETLSQALGSMISLLAAGCMFFPAIGVLLTRLITKEGFRNAWLNPRFKGNIKVYLLAYFGPAILSVLGALVYFLVFPEKFDPNCGYLALTMEAAGVPVEAYPMPLSLMMAIELVEALLLGPILNFVTCFGEEWGWRGYLLPKMAEKFSPLPMLLINGVIWGLWHAPLTIVGHNYGMGYPGFPFTGIAAMCCFCTVTGVFMSYICMKTQSCIPAILAHGGMNGIAAAGMYFTADGGNPFVGPAPTGIIGAVPFIVTAILMYVFYFRRKQD